MNHRCSYFGGIECDQSKCTECFIDRDEVWYGDSVYTRCFSCDVSGLPRYLIWQEDGSYLCRACVSKANNSNLKTCPMCGGVGVLDVPANPDYALDKKVCETCNGTGIEPTQKPNKVNGDE